MYYSGNIGENRGALINTSKSLLTLATFCCEPLMRFPIISCEETFCNAQFSSSNFLLRASDALNNNFSFIYTMFSSMHYYASYFLLVNFMHVYIMSVYINTCIYVFVYTRAHLKWRMNKLYIYICITLYYL